MTKRIKDTERKHWLNSAYARFSPHQEYRLPNGLVFTATVGYDWLTTLVKQIKVTRASNSTLPALADMLTAIKACHPLGTEIELIDQTEGHEKRSPKKPQNLRMNHCDKPTDKHAKAVKTYDTLKANKLQHKINQLLAS